MAFTGIILYVLYVIYLKNYQITVNVYEYWGDVMIDRRKRVMKTDAENQYTIDCT